MRKAISITADTRITFDDGTSTMLITLGWKETQQLAEAMRVNKGLERGRPSEHALKRRINAYLITHPEGWERKGMPMPKDFDAIPNCPRCGAVMIKRTRRDTGAEFWGCTRYPECKGTRPINWSPDAPTPDNDDDESETGFPKVLHCPNDSTHPSVPVNSDDQMSYLGECGICGATMSVHAPEPADEKSREYIAELEAELLGMTERAESAEATIKAMLPPEPNTERQTHYQFERVLSALRAGVDGVYLCGIPGTGKTEIAADVSHALNVPLYVRACFAQMTESKLFGFIDAGGTYHRTALREAVEHGGVYVLDEMDNGNSNLVASLNALISNKAMPIEFPDGMVDRHPEFYLIATANTWGTGPTAEFMGRNALDRATINRLTKIGIEIDEQLEESVTRNLIEHTTADRILGVVRAIRERVTAQGLRVFVTPRMSFQVAKLMQSGWSMRDALDTTDLASIDTATRDMLLNGIEGVN